MKFNDPTLDCALSHWQGSADLVERCCADNVRFEERVSLQRQAFFEAEALADPGELARKLEDYSRTYVTVDGEPPHTFIKDLGPDDLGDLEDTQVIIRYERISRPLGDAGLSFEDLNTAFVDGDTATLDAFIDVWNNSGSRDWRPMFGAFKDELADVLPPADWIMLLRDRLGLAHHSCTAGAVPIALMAYTVAEVKKSAAAYPSACAFTAPTVLDQGPWPFFFPAPSEICGGRTMSLNAVRDETYLLSEILHFRIPYRRRHLSALGMLSAPLPPFDLMKLRNHHLLALQIVSGRSDFGQEML
jgi:hypothetical protein